MSEARRAKPGEFPDVLDGRVGAGHDFDLTDAVKGTLISQFACDFDCAHNGSKIEICSEIVSVDHGRIVKIVAHETDSASARRLNKSWRNGERVRRRSTKARGRFGCHGRQLFEDEINVGISRWATRQVSLRLDGIAAGWPIRHLACVLEHDAGDEHMVLQDAWSEIERIRYDPVRAYMSVLAYLALRRKKESDSALREFASKYHAGYAYASAEIYAFRNEPDEGFQWLDRAYAEHNTGLINTKTDPLLKSLHNDPRFAALLKKLNLQN